MTDSCPTDGSRRTVVDRAPDAVTWECPVCGLATERHDPEGER